MATGTFEEPPAGRVSWLYVLSPQQSTAPSEPSEQVKAKPAVTSLALVIPETATGVQRANDVPSPSWPEPFHPQQRASPFDRVAQVWWAPAASETAPLS